MSNTKNLNLVFDIGCNVGNTLDIFKDVAQNVIGFEPNPELVNILREKYSNSNVIIDDRAISNKEGTEIFNISKEHTISTISNDWITNSRFTGEYEWSQSILIPTTTLNNIIDQYGIPDYIKIDVEGHEYEVISSFSKLLNKTLISFEWAEEQKEKIIKSMNHLYSIGYKNFAFTFFDDVLFEDQISWTFYPDFDFATILDSDRKELWGMLYIKK